MRSAILGILLAFRRAGTCTRSAINDPDQAAKARIAGMLSVDLSGR